MLPRLSPDGIFWLQGTDMNLETGTWSQLWLQRGQSAKEILLAKDKPNTWASLLTSTLPKTPPSLPPNVSLDSRKNIYLVALREQPNPKPFTIQVANKKLEDSAPVQLALVVLNSSKKVLATLPWSQQPFHFQKIRWIKPLPNGKGFYRIEYGEREAHVIFQSLP